MPHSSTIPLRSLVVALSVLPTAVSGQQRTPDGRPDLQGIWNSATATPLERPSELADKPFFTPEEAAEWVQSFIEGNEEPARGSAQAGIGTFNTVYREYGTGVVKTLRTAIITEPSDGRIPPLTSTAAEVRRRSIERQQNMENPEDLSLQDRCVAFSTSGPPMLPYTYNSNYQIVQTRDAILLHVEMIHDARVIYLDGRPGPPPSIRLPSGYSAGRWEGDTLVVDTENFNDAGGFYGGAGGNFGWDENLRVVERFSLYDSDTLLYRFEIHDPTAFTAAWKGELTLARSTGNIYEYACHEANYSMTGMLSGARAEEARTR
ncbi:MAG: hypothetical protein EXR91_09745 [Gemmatimonadetes bacterium]|nr:hypothetical protein [Gemmatimonadota bacterium]